MGVGIESAIVADMYGAAQIRKMWCVEIKVLLLTSVRIDYSYRRLKISAGQSG